MQWIHAHIGYASSYVEVLIFFNLKLQLKDTESAIKNKLTHFLSELKRLKFVTILVLEFKNI